ncbi:MAG: hypothetical protein M0R51_14040 [Clostridia bacterium]|jgi:hypothetical protein|nr:hypothetical protein [Clostridia bacterium]
MQDYHIYSHYVADEGTPKTSPNYERKEKKTVAVKSITKSHTQSKHSFLSTAKVEAAVIGAAYKINAYVGAYTENTVKQRKVQLGLTALGLARLAVTNPVMAGIGAVAFVADAGIKYNIRIYKENLSADYMKQLSGGTVTQR